MLHHFHIRAAGGVWLEPQAGPATYDVGGVPEGVTLHQAADDPRQAGSAGRAGAQEERRLLAVKRVAVRHRYGCQRQRSILAYRRGEMHLGRSPARLPLCVDTGDQRVTATERAGALEAGVEDERLVAGHQQTAIKLDHAHPPVPDQRPGTVRRDALCVADVEGVAGDRERARPGEATRRREVERNGKAKGTRAGRGQDGGRERSPRRLLDWSGMLERTPDTKPSDVAISRSGWCTVTALISKMPSVSRPERKSILQPSAEDAVSSTSVP